MRLPAVLVFAGFLTSLLMGVLAGPPAAPLPGARGAALTPSTAAFTAGFTAGPGAPSDGCLGCHQGIEEMHPGFPLSCVDCHGGNGEAREKTLAHVASPIPSARVNERVAPQDQDLAYVRFVNPMDLRVAEKSCGECHGDLVQHLSTSLHGTTAAHLSDGFFETGHQAGRESRYGVFGTVALRGAESTGIDRVSQPPRFDASDDPRSLATHFPDLVRKECMQCHLWSQGRAVRGRVGFDGEYRGAGCAACHVPYREDGLSESADPTVERVEPGHPMRHSLVTSPPTETCTTCHYGDASIGLHFRGLSQLPPGAPGGPEIEGTTDSLLHRSFFINDPEITPPDVHHASGMHCVDCHTLEGVMGDGRLASKMEDATEITCQACHGTFTARTNFKTERGTRLRHLSAREDGSVWLTSKVTGEAHRVKQVVDVLDPFHDDHNPEGARSMTGVHKDVACYTCHAGWNVNFLGFHFYRNEALTQLDLVSGERTPGRVTTQEKVFTTWKSFYAGLDERGRFAPYLTGFSTMGTVDNADGERILDQELPVTQNGLSGLTMIHHQLHSTRPTARTCVECHRASETWGMGSENFRLGRQLAFAADRRGVEILAFDRENPQASTALARFVLPDIVDIEVGDEPLQGRAQTIFVTEGRRGVHSIDVRDPRSPARLDFQMTVSPRGMALAGTHLFVADGIGGLKVFNVEDPADMRLVATVPMIDAHEVEVRWPYAYVADGPGGLVVVDVRLPVAPKIVGGLALGEGGGSGAIDLDVLFQYSRPKVNEEGAPSKDRTPSRRVVAVCDEEAGPILVDATEPAHLKIIRPSVKPSNQAYARPNRMRYPGLVVRTHVDLAKSQGGEATVERDVLYFLLERQQGNGAQTTFLRAVDISDPTDQRQLSNLRIGDSSEMIDLVSWYNAPFLRPLALIPGSDGVVVMDMSNSKEPVALGSIAGMLGAYVFRAERFPLDQMLDADGRALKDVSHPGSRWLLRGEIEGVLDVPSSALGTVDAYSQESIAAASSARRMFARADKDRSGLLTGEERAMAGGDEVDKNGDGRLTLSELASYADDEQRTVIIRSEPLVAPEERVGLDGDISRILDGLDPFAHDTRKRDGKLDRKEAEAAFFAALDLDGSGGLSIDELSRHPGELRDLRFGDRAALGQFSKLNRSGRGSVSPREFQLRDEEWIALDKNGDGFIQLDPTRFAERRSRGEQVPDLEWPTRRAFPVFDLPPFTSADDLRATFDKNGDGVLTKQELRKRPGLLAQLDADASSVLEEDELTRVETLLLRWGLEGVPDEFMTRWDVDGSGKVEADELAPVAATLMRVRAPRRKRR